MAIMPIGAAWLATSKPRLFPVSQFCQLLVHQLVVILSKSDLERGFLELRV
jgi:hypothetical protein